MVVVVVVAVVVVVVVVVVEPVVPFTMEMIKISKYYNFTTY